MSLAKLHVRCAVLSALRPGPDPPSLVCDAWGAGLPWTLGLLLPQHYRAFPRKAQTVSDCESGGDLNCCEL